MKKAKSKKIALVMGSGGARGYAHLLQFIAAELNPCGAPFISIEEKVLLRHWRGTGQGYGQSSFGAASLKHLEGMAGQKVRVAQVVEQPLEAGAIPKGAGHGLAELETLY